MQLSALYRYPLKSARGESLQRAPLDALGLAGDRRWMVVDAPQGRFLSQRQLPQMARLQAHWQGSDLVLDAPGMPGLTVALPAADAPLRQVSVWDDSLPVPDAGEAAAGWLSEWLGRPCRLVQVPEQRARQVNTKYAQPGDKVGFADGFPFLLIGQASLDDLCARVGRPLEMERFRPNLVVAGSEPYAEDRWKRIRIGSVAFRVAKPCSRCAIPTLDPLTGERSPDHEPIATLKSYRKGEGGVFFGQNLIADGIGELAVGMPVEVLE